MCSEKIKAPLALRFSISFPVSVRMKATLLFFLGLLLVATCTPTKKCKDNEEVVACHNTCEPQCGYTPKACTEQCLMNYCDCKDGFVRNKAGDCVDPISCTKETTQCPENESFFGCGTACEPTCEEPEPAFCTKQCIVNVCQCSKGFVRHGHSCIAKKDCPK